MRTLLLLALTPFVAVVRADDIPKGDVAKYSFSASKIFPGTVRDYWVYVPKQYDPAKPACLYVNQDGIQFKAPEVFDKLIAAKEMPITIGVFVMHGRVPALTPNALDRFNRSYEYDGLGDNYVRFLLEELLPDVEKKTTADGRAIKFSKDGNDRAIGGSSSGAICAFTAAWERPDSFRRVFSAIGTYVGLRGGNNYPTLIRKTEPKPIRIFLQDGSNDLNIYGGDWWMANQEMERALKFAGYEVEHAWDDGKHANDGGTKVFPDAMRWLWKDWPTPVKAGLGSPQMREILLPGEPWTLVTGDRLNHTPLTSNGKGGVLFDSRDSKGAMHTLRISSDDKITSLFEHLVPLSARAFGPDSRLYATGMSQPHNLLTYDRAGKLASITDGISASDLTVRYDGRLVASSSERPFGIWVIQPTGEKKFFDSLPEGGTGIAFSPDQTQVYIAELRSRWVWAIQVEGDGTIARAQRFMHMHLTDDDPPWMRALAVDRDGRVYVTSHLGIQVCDQLGRVNCIVSTPNRDITGLCFGGEKFDTLFAACGDKIYKRKVKVQGANAFEPPIKPKKPGL